MRSFFLRCVVFLACIPSGGALLAKVYGVSQLQTVVLWLFVPGIVLIAGIYHYAHKPHPEISQAIFVGAVGGLIGTFGYDLIRIPFLLMGQRVFAPISAYGVWLLDAGISSRFTEAAGWAYHFSNGITFGIMYALWMRNKHPGWAILWGLALETIAVVSPFADIFALRQAYGALGIAYLGHVAYGAPLGWLTSNWDRVADWHGEQPLLAKNFALLIAILALLSPIFNPRRIALDQSAQPNSFIVQETKLNPDWLQIEKNNAISISNPGENTVKIVQKPDKNYTLMPAATISLPFPNSGIYQIYVEREGRTKSSFVIVEPVEELD